MHVTWDSTVLTNEMNAKDKYYLIKVNLLIVLPHHIVYLIWWSVAIGTNNLNSVHSQFIVVNIVCFLFNWIWLLSSHSVSVHLLDLIISIWIYLIQSNPKSTLTWWFLAMMSMAAPIAPSNPNYWIRFKGDTVGRNTSLWSRDTDLCIDDCTKALRAGQVDSEQKERKEKVQDPEIYVNCITDLEANINLDWLMNCVVSQSLWAPRCTNLRTTNVHRDSEVLFCYSSLFEPKLNQTALE